MYTRQPTHLRFRHSLKDVIVIDDALRKLYEWTKEMESHLFLQRFLQFFYRVCAVHIYNVRLLDVFIVSSSSRSLQRTCLGNKIRLNYLSALLSTISSFV